MDVWINSVREAEIHLALHANSRYRKIEIEELDREKKPFTFQHRLYRFIRMPFELWNAPGYFQRITDVTLPNVKEHFAFRYLDYTFVFFMTPGEHVRHIRKVLMLLNNAAVTQKLKNCQFFTKTTNCLEHIMHPRRLEISLRTTDAIRGI